MADELITSTSNIRIKEIRKLKERKEQKRTGLFYMEGLRIIGEAFGKGALIRTLLVCQELIRNEFAQSLIDQANEKNIEILFVEKKVFESVAIKDNPQGIAAVGKMQLSSLNELVPQEKGIFVALDRIADPGNLGTIIRTADAVDCKGVILLEDCTSPYDSAAIRGSMGAVFSQKIVSTDYGSFLNWTDTNAIQLVGTSDKAVADYTQINYSDPIILLMGSEREGLPQMLMDRCDAMARIPMLRSSDSLNLAVATGVMLYQVYNQHRCLLRIEQ